MPDILTSFNQNGSPFSNLNGGPANVPNFADSKLHDTYSINEIPALLGKPQPSVLDLQGEVPANNYREMHLPALNNFKKLMNAFNKSTNRFKVSKIWRR